jgi:adenine deaminase
VDAARVLGTDHLGVVAVGRAADMLAVRGDPSTDIAAIREVGLIFHGAGWSLTAEPRTEAHWPVAAPEFASRATLRVPISNTLRALEVQIQGSAFR